MYSNMVPQYVLWMLDQQSLGRSKIRKLSILPKRKPNQTAKKQERDSEWKATCLPRVLAVTIRSWPTGMYEVSGFKCATGDLPMIFSNTP